MFSKEKITNKGKELSYLLRHDKTYKFDEHGYRTIDDLIMNHDFTKELIEEIVLTNDKKRYEYSKDKTKIRARQGHSISINVDLKKSLPPDVLYHGTAVRFHDKIMTEGIKKMQRQHVHLSSDKNTAFIVGKRHGTACVIVIDTKRMVADGVEFYLSNNNVWLTDFVNKKYILDTIYA